MTPLKHSISANLSSGLPGLLYLFINNYIPMGRMVIAFKKYKYNKGILGSDWTGTEKL